jgi:hypothetical protein
MTSYGGAVTQTIPSVPDATSFELVPANPFRRFIFIANLGSNDFGLSLTGATITGTTATAANPVLPFGSGSVYTNYFDFVPTGAITVYQASGGALEELLVIEG